MGSCHCSQGVAKGILLPERALLHGNQGLLKFSMRLNSMSLTSHIVTVKWSSRKLLLAWLLPSVWVISCLSHRASLGHSGWFSTLNNVKRKGALGTSLCTQNKQVEHISKSMLCFVYIFLSALDSGMSCNALLSKEYKGWSRYHLIFFSPLCLQKLHYKLTSPAILCLHMLPQPLHFNSITSIAGELLSMERSVWTY